MTETDRIFQAHPGSFRDPAGRVYVDGSRILRLLSKEGAGYFQAAQAASFWKDALASGSIVGTWDVPLAAPGLKLPPAPFAVERVLEHSPIPFISYPFEWPFHLLRRAALLHLDLHLEALESGLNLVDGTAYNVQFVGARPVFIDVLSFRPYAAGDYWLGYQQFCETFLAPLLLTAFCNIPYNAMYRGNLAGIPVTHIGALLPWRAKLKPLVVMHISAQLMLARRLAASVKTQAGRPGRRPLPKSSLFGLLRSLRNGIAGLEPGGVAKTVWSDYETDNSYDSDDTAKKAAFVARHVGMRKPKLLWDIGCNTGLYSETALRAGAERVVGFDSDMGALTRAVARADRQGLNYLPLYMNLSNPSPDLGWANSERQSLAARANPEMILALAVIHHLAIAQNVPLSSVIEWFLGLAPAGIIEFVPKSDPMTRLLLANRADIFPDYNLENFLACLEAAAGVVETCTLASGRVLVAYERRGDGSAGAGFA